MSFDYGVLDDLYKIDVIELAKILNIPNTIINSQPSTGYYEGQTHENELGATLEEQDVLTYLLFDKKLNIKTIINKYKVNKGYLEIMVNKYKNSAHKRMLRQEHVTIDR
jgi:NAD+ synthase